MKEGSLWSIMLQSPGNRLKVVFYSIHHMYIGYSSFNTQISAINHGRRADASKEYHGDVGLDLTAGYKG